MGAETNKRIAAHNFMCYNQVITFGEVFSMLEFNMQETAGGNPEK